MPITNKEKWDKYNSKNKDEYGGACVKLARRVMEYLDKEDKFDSNELITRANKEFNEGITGFMAGAIATMVSQCHSRGEEFKKSWNNEVSGDKMEGVNNPALMTIQIKD